MVTKTATPERSDQRCVEALQRLCVMKRTRASGSFTHRSLLVWGLWWWRQRQRQREGV
jgi:hypothetical protein